MELLNQNSQTGSAKPKTHECNGLADFSLLAVFSAPALQQPRQAYPERVDQYRQTQLF